jgi:hypothetical protein
MIPVWNTSLEQCSHTWMTTESSGIGVSIQTCGLSSDLIMQPSIDWESTDIHTSHHQPTFRTGLYTVPLKNVDYLKVFWKHRLWLLWSSFKMSLHYKLTPTWCPICWTTFKEQWFSTLTIHWKYRCLEISKGRAWALGLLLKYSRWF